MAQMTIVRYLQRYDIDRHIGKIVEVYKRRRDVAVGSIERYFPANIRFIRPEGGLFIWIELPTGISAREILNKCLEKKIAFVPGSSFFRTSIKRISSGSIIPIYPETGSRKDLKSSGRSSKNISANPNDLFRRPSRRANLEKRSSRREFFICLSRPKKFAGCPKISRRIYFN